MRLRSDVLLRWAQAQSGAEPQGVRPSAARWVPSVAPSRLPHAPRRRRSSARGRRDEPATRPRPAPRPGLQVRSGRHPRRWPGVAAEVGAGPAADHGTVLTDSWGLHQFPAVPTAPGPWRAPLGHASWTRPRTRPQTRLPDTPPGHASRTRLPDTPPGHAARTRHPAPATWPHLQREQLCSPSLVWKTFFFVKVSFMLARSVFIIF